MEDEAIEVFPEPDPDLAALILSITPMQFVHWARRETNKKRLHLRQALIRPTEMEDSSLMWTYITGRLGMTAVGVGSGAHQYLILKMERERTKLYDPLSGISHRETAEINYSNSRFSKNLMGKSGKAEQAGISVRELLSAEEYELDVSLGRIQQDGYNCCPLALYSAMMANANNPKYVWELNTEEIRKISKVSPRRII